MKTLDQLRAFFMRHVSPEPNSGCWLWDGACDGRAGYGKFGMNGKTVYAHRASVELFKNEKPDGAYVCHKCDVHECVNPDHLFLGTQSDNLTDASKKGRMSNPHAVRGENHHAAKLSRETALAIFNSSGSQAEIARHFNVPRYIVYNIKRGTAWAWLTGRPIPESRLSRSAKVRMALTWVVLLLAPSLALAQGSAGSGTMFSSPGPPQNVLTVSPSGGRFKKICDADCTSLTSTCAAGSALASLSAGSTTPTLIDVAPGTYQECVVVDNVKNVELFGHSAIIRPAVTAPTDVSGGVFRVGTVTTTANATQGITIHGFKIQNDALSSPEGAIEVGKESGPGAGNSSSWTDVLIYDNETIGNHDSIHIYGTGLVTDTDPPRIIVRNNKSRSGSDGIVLKSTARARIYDNDIFVMSNFCETSTTTFLSQQTGTAVSGSTTTMVIDAADDFGVDGGYVGRRFVLSGASCGDADTLAGFEGWVTGYSTSADTITFTPSTGGESVDSGCTYTIDAVPNFAAAPCTDIDWTTIRAAAGSPFGYWKETCFHLGLDASTSAPDLSFLDYIGNRCRIDVNDFGTTGGNCGGSTGQGNVSCWLMYDSAQQNILIDQMDCTINVNVDMRAITCTDPINGVAFHGDPVVEGTAILRNSTITINNNADDDEQSSGIVCNSTLAANLTVDNVYENITSVGGATETYIVEGNSDTLTVGRVSAPEAVTTSGTLSYMEGNNFCQSVRTSFGNPGEGAGATEFLAAFDSGGLVPNATEANVDDYITPFPLYFKDLRVDVDVAPDNGGGTQSRAITLMDDTAATAITCTISEAQTSCTYTGSQVAVAAGSKMDWKLVNTGTPATAGTIWITVCASP